MRRVVISLVVGALGAALVGELAVRILCPVCNEVERPYNPETGPGGLRQTTYGRAEDPELAFVLRPGAKAEMIYPAWGENPERRIVYQVNRHGFRDVDVSETKPEGVVRVAVLGDSFTHGNGCHLEETFPKVAEATLGKEAPELPVEVLNCGVGGYNTRQQVEIMKWRVLALDPDLVVIAFYVNDVFPPRGDVPRRDEPEEPAGFLERAFTPLAPASRFAGLVSGWLREQRAERDHFRDFEANYREDSPGWLRVREALEDAARICAREGVELRLTIVPNPAYPSANPFAAYESQVVALAAELGIEFLDVSPAVRDVSAAELIVHPHDRHGSATFNRLIGEELGRRLLPAVRDLAGS